MYQDILGGIEVPWSEHVFCTSGRGSLDGVLAVTLANALSQRCLFGKIDQKSLAVHLQVCCLFGMSCTGDALFYLCAGRTVFARPQLFLLLLRLGPAPLSNNSAIIQYVCIGTFILLGRIA